MSDDTNLPGDEASDLPDDRPEVPQGDADAPASDAAAAAAGIDPTRPEPPTMKVPMNPSVGQPPKLNQRTYHHGLCGSKDAYWIPAFVRVRVPLCLHMPQPTGLVRTNLAI